MANKVHVTDFDNYNLSDVPELEFTILSEEMKNVEKFKRKSYSTTFKVKHNSAKFTNFLSIHEELENKFNSIIKKSINKAKPEDRLLPEDSEN